ncbi:hypothetical protein KBY57_00150 [Cyanobium sp. Aljojuca 7D2]|uniref:glycosyltransferase n=1 Tax=Cyanobium sp. Aljojuca 7D2 TaxID=2823698 RepID=UPI0020CCFBA7|nr:glycosyltransferase family 2 protein [Cyanobium sp. Aljojuca 7D2]MCP9889468.1 hypothetical protein [Cyanobium sp. Aljojuca 7D2]
MALQPGGLEGVAWLVAALMAGLVVLHLRLAWPFLRGSAPSPVSAALAEPSSWPAAEVVLCLRGADPALPDLVRSLATQSYAGPWRLQVLVDSPTDGAWLVVERALAHRGPQASWQEARLTALADPQGAASRKCASLLQAFAALDPSTLVVALVDGDAAIGTNWLSELVAACLQPGVGAVSGNRWYAPATGSGVGQVRAIWNAGALLLMGWMQVPWAGSLALRRELLTSTGWLSQLRTSLCEDTPLLNHLHQAGWRYGLLPQLLSCDCDDLRWHDLPALERWISRQLLLVRLHHPAWPWLAAHAVATSTLSLVAVLLLGLGQLPGLWAMAPAPKGALLAALLTTDLLWAGLLWGLGRALGQPAPRQLLALPLWVALTQLIYGLAALRAACAQQVEWRGSCYALRRQGGHWHVSRAAAPGAGIRAPAAGWFR